MPKVKRKFKYEKIISLYATGNNGEVYSIKLSKEIVDFLLHELNKKESKP
jgi:hypothetical protein